MAIGSGDFTIWVKSTLKASNSLSSDLSYFIFHHEIIYLKKIIKNNFILSKDGDVNFQPNTKIKQK